MDGQTDRILIAIPRLHYMQRGKKRTNEYINKKVNKYLNKLRTK